MSEPNRSPALGLLISINAMFFMGLFFFVSAYFAPDALAKKGPRTFLRDRFWRLGLPSVLVLAVTTLTMGKPQFLHLWFVVDLLALNLLYALLADPHRPNASPGRDPTTLHVLGFIVVLGVATAGLRIAYPIDRWVNLLWFLPIEPAHWVQYGSFFILGLWAGRSRWVERIPDRMGMGALVVAVVSVLAFGVYRFWPNRPVHWFDTGGLRWQNLNLALLEAVVCVALAIGLLWLFRKVANREIAAVQAFSADAYAIYCLHLPVVVALHFALRPLPAGPLTKFALTTLLGVLGSWALSRFLLRSTALGRRIF